MELVFEEVTRLTVVPSPENYGSEIFEATLLVDDGLIYFADVADWSPKSDDQDATWISAKKLKWRDASDWMGEELRYDVPRPAR